MKSEARAGRPTLGDSDTPTGCHEEYGWIRKNANWRPSAPGRCEASSQNEAWSRSPPPGSTTAESPASRRCRSNAWGIGASPVFDAFLPNDAIVAGRYAGGPVGDLRLHPDLTRATVLAEQPGWAWAPAVRYRQDGVVHPQDQRSIARAAVAALTEAGYAARMAFEIEWTLSSTEPDFTPAASGPAYGYTRVVEQSDYLRDLLIALDRQGVAVDQIHP